jgi:ribosome modulation factor
MTTKAILKRAYNEGSTAFKAGTAEHCCPYDEHEQRVEAKVWHEGYADERLLQRMKTPQR